MGLCRQGFRRPLVLSVSIAAAVLVMYGQQPSGEIRLSVQDPTGAAISASGKLDDQVFQTDEEGHYDFPNLAPGPHRLSVSKQGFATQVLSAAVRPGVTTRETVKLELASTASSIDVVATTPLVGANLTKDQIAAPVQTATAEDIENSGSIDLSGFLNRRMNGVFVNQMVGNPFQPDVNFRGYTASPVLGTPEGISVYVDGVRQNQPFGDVVAWDLIPKNAIAEMTLVPGSDPLFGLNTLGGSISVQSKDGITYPGLSGDLLYGSSARKEADATWGGGKATGFNWFLAGTAFHENGWRYDSPSTVGQGYARFGWRTEKTSLALTTTYVYDSLYGNALQDFRLLAANYASAYTPGDDITNRAPMFNFIAQHTFHADLTFSGNVWFRNIDTRSINPNYNNDVLGNNIYQPTPNEQAVLAATGYSGFPASGANVTNTPFPFWPCLAEVRSQGNVDGTCDATTVYGGEAQNDFGTSGQFTWSASTPAGRNQLSAGGLYDRGRIDFTQNTVYGYLTPKLTIANVPVWQDSSVSLHGVTPNWAVYLSDTLTLAKNLNLTVSGRYNRFTVNNLDRLARVAGPGSLTGDYVFQRFDPAVGLTFSPVSSLNAYARYSQSNRPPTAIELGCADPENPCSLPNAFASDPALQQVVSQTWEVGLRGKPESTFVRNLNWNVGAFRGENHNDILFVSSVLLGTGYFQNFASTERQGFDADLDGRIGLVTWGLNYTLLSATYQSAAILNGSGNSSADIARSGFPGLGGNIYVNPGDRIPLIPKHTGKAYALIQATTRLSFELNEIAVSSSYARGNENNAYQPDGVHYLGPGVSPGYAVTNAQASYKLSKRLQLALQLENLFGRHYDTAAQLANTAFTANGAVQAFPFPSYEGGPYAGKTPAQSVTFFAPGAPRRIWAEVLFHF